MIKNHEEHQSLISSFINEIHGEFDKILRVVVEGTYKISCLVIKLKLPLLDRFYGAKKESAVNAQNVDLPHIRRLFESLLSALIVLQVDDHKLNVSGNKKKLNKALTAFPCGFINVDDVSSIALRLLRINSSTSPKQVRADKRFYDELIHVHLQDLHCLAWKIISFLFKNVEIGTEIFERELAALTRDQIKSDLKTIKQPGKGSERALEQFIDLAKHSALFNGQVFVNEIVRSGVLLEISSVATQKFSSLLRSGGIEKETSGSNNKKARYHQVSESDQKKLENAQKIFCSELKESFKALSRNFIVFESAYSHLSPQEHISLTENVLNAILALFQSQHNFKFVPEIFEGEYLRILVDSLSFALVSFQPAYLPPFLPISIRILNLIAGKSDASGLSARRALLQVELMIHPRRLGPVTFRPASDAIVKVFERPEAIVDVPMVTETNVIKTVSESPVSIDPPPLATAEIKHVQEENSEDVKVENELAIVKEEALTKNFVESPPISETKRSFEQHSKNNTINDDEDDITLPQIVDIGPDDN